MARIAIFVYGLIAYALFLVTILYAIGFVGNRVVPKGIDDGFVGPWRTAVIVNMLLLAAFAVQHTIMARPGFKRWFTRIVPRPAERSTFVLAASLLLLVLFWQWRPMPGVVWRVEQPWAWWGLTALSLVGWALVFHSTFVIDHMDLFGLRQVWVHLRGMPYADRPFMERSLYKVIRHPLMAGFIIAFWATPVMTEGHLLFAGVTTVYILVGITFEERDLIAHFGETYLGYRRRTPALIPLPKRRTADRTTRRSSAKV